MKRILSVMVLGVLLSPVFSGAQEGDKPEGMDKWELSKSSRDGYICTGPAEASSEITWASRCAGGKPVGTGVERYADGTVAEGPYVDGKMNGHWVVRFADGKVAEGPYVDGKQNGHWVMLSADGTVAEGPKVDGKMNGHWILRYTDGMVAEGPYVDDEENGHWVVRKDGVSVKLCFRAGEKVDCN